MGKYGMAAEIAAQSLAESGGDPRAAWKMAVGKVFADKLPSQDKGCPRDSFLSLCELGYIKDVARGSYTQSEMNRGYVVRAVAAIRNDAALANDEKALWRIVTNGGEKTYNQQMDVVTSLWRSGLLKIS